MARMRAAISSAMTTERWCPTCAAAGNRQIRLPPVHVGRKREGEEVVDDLEERLGLGLVQDVVADVGVEPVERAQLVDPMGVGEEAAVDHVVDVERKAVL